MNKRLYVGNITYGISDEQLKDLFSQAGNVTYSRIIKRPDGKSKGFGFVEMSTEEEAQKAIEKFDQYELEGRKLKVNEAKAQTERESGRNFSGYRNKNYDRSYSSRETSQNPGRRSSALRESDSRSELNQKLIQLRKDLKDKLSKSKS
ncbi:MAG: RNA-binding protein [Actinobacteria bacterium]|nr:RNA-binding protein [Actinomycetota bacterium]